jgi:hypothetical protein
MGAHAVTVKRALGVYKFGPKGLRNGLHGCTIWCSYAAGDGVSVNDSGTA